MKYKQGVPKGYTHKWKYLGDWVERKVARGKWILRFRATKTRHGSSRGGLRKGNTVVWKINAIQRATKVGGRTYLTDMIGTKQLIGLRTKKRHPLIQYSRRRR